MTSASGPGAATDYEGDVHRRYARGRALDDRQYARWLDAFAGCLPDRRPLTGLDLGSGTGRFSARLADAFGPVVAVEPSDAMRGVAEREQVHPDVAYRPGAAESIPVDDAAVDYCVMFLVWHHVARPADAAREIARVLRPGGVLVCRTPFADLMPHLWWLDHFPGGPQADAAMYRMLEDDLRIFAGAGLEPAPGPVWVDDVRITRRQRFEKVRTRTLSVLARMPDDDVAAGMASLQQDVATDPDALEPPTRASLLVLRAPA